MNRSAQLQFQRLPPEAQRAAFWRLAWSGMSVEQMAQRTGWSLDQVRRVIDEETLQTYPSWQPVGKWMEARASAVA